jgi:hypothetical protein
MCYEIAKVSNIYEFYNSFRKYKFESRLNTEPWIHQMLGICLPGFMQLILIHKQRKLGCLILSVLYRRVRVSLVFTADYSIYMIWALILNAEFLVYLTQITDILIFITDCSVPLIRIL